MEFFKKTTIDFMKLTTPCGIVSIILCALSIIIICIYGLNWGLDFTGGTQMQVKYEQVANLPQIRDSLEQHGYEKAVVTQFGNSHNVMVRIALKKGVTQSQAADTIHGIIHGQIMSVDYVGPQVGKELKTNGALALLIALIATSIYIALRFEYRFAISSSVALLHDPIIILGVFSFFHIEFDLTALAAVLTVIGYSLNDTVVVFDRVRENFRKVRNKTPAEIVNLSVNQTLSRTIMTSGLTLVAVLALYIYGGEAVKGFSLAFLIGIIVGTYSSIYVAGTLAVKIGLDRADFLPKARAELDGMP